jgi:type II secretory pathway component GspD/PulD (secretin)
MITAIARWLHCAVILLLCCPAAVQAGNISLSIQDSDIRDVMQLLSREQRLNIFVADGVSGQVSINVYEMETTEAIALIAESAGFVVEKRDGSYFVIEREDSGKYHQSDRMEVRVFRVQYASAADIETAIQDHLSNYGSVKSLEDGNMVIVEDMPAFIDDIEIIIDAIDREPKQIMIEAKILEISLTDNQSYGLNWKMLFDASGGKGEIGTQRLANPISKGLFAQYSNSNVELVLSALKERGRLRTISTPKLLAMEGLEAETVVGTNIGYRVTTTVNLVTTETIEFLETGIILKVTPSVDRSGRIMLDIHPEVSAGTVSDDGIPSKTTTQVSTRMLVPDGRTVFLGGLIKHSISNTREGVPGLGDIPLIGNLFSNNATNILSTEIVVLITPYIVNFENEVPEDTDILRIEEIKATIDSELGAKSIEMEEKFGKSESTGPRMVSGDHR